MKNLKKFAALLLAGAMALLMLTACGGGGGSVNNPEEQKVLNHISNQKGVHVTSAMHSFVEWQKSICERISKVRCSLATTSSSPRSM